MTASTTGNTGRQPGHRHGVFYGYRVTDDVLFHAWLTTTEKLLLGAFAAHPSRSPSHRYLRAHTPIHHDSTETALTRIEEVFGLAIFDRPRGPQDRDPISRRFARANRATMMHPDADPTATANERRQVILPATIAQQLPRGQRNSGLAVLVALVYAREQLRRGAIHADDEAVAAMLHTEARKVRRIREQMIRDGVLCHAKKAPGSAIYTMPGATARQPEPSAVQIERTRRLRLLPIDVGAPIFALANDREWAAIETALVQTKSVGHALAVVEAWKLRKAPRPMLGDAPLAADELLRGLNSTQHRLSSEPTQPSRFPTAMGGDVDRSGEHDSSVQGSERSYTEDLEDQDLSDRAERGRNVSDEGLERIASERRFSSSEQAVAAILAEVKPALAEVFGPERAAPKQRAAQIVGTAVLNLARRLNLRGGLQATIIADEVKDQLDGISPSKPIGERYAQLQAAARWLTYDDELYERAKNARPAPRSDVLAQLENEFSPVFAETPADEE